MRIAIGAIALVAMASLAHAEVIYVDIDAIGADDGTSWADAYVDLQDALGRALHGDEVWVAEGTYKPTDGIDREISFEFPGGVGIYGGFDGSEAVRSERDWEAHPTILSGDIGEPNPAARRAVLERPLPAAPIEVHRAWFDGMRDFVDQQLTTEDNSYRVVTVDGGRGVVLDGLTVRDASRGMEGGGLACFSCSITVRNTKFLENTAAGFGGGIYASGSSKVQISDSRFVDNYSGYVGAGIALLDAAALTVANTVFYGCFANINSGGIWANVAGTSIEVRDSQFIYNTADDATGALAATGEVYLVRTRFVGNSSFWGDGAVYAGGSFRAESCSFIGNSSIAETGVIRASGALSVLNSEFINNLTISPDPQMEHVACAIMSAGPLDVINTSFSGNDSPHVGAITHRGSDPAAITNSVIWGNAAVPGSVAVWTGLYPILCNRPRGS